MTEVKSGQMTVWMSMIETGSVSRDTGDCGRFVLVLMDKLEYGPLY